MNRTINVLETLPFHVISSVWFLFLPHFKVSKINISGPQTVSPFWWASLTSFGNIWMSSSSNQMGVNLKCCQWCKHGVNHDFLHPFRTVSFTSFHGSNSFARANVEPWRRTLMNRGLNLMFFNSTWCHKGRSHVRSSHFGVFPTALQNDCIAPTWKLHLQLWGGVP